MWSDCNGQFYERGDGGIFIQDFFTSLNFSICSQHIFFMSLSIKDWAELSGKSYASLSDINLLVLPGCSHLSVNNGCKEPT